jgi:hypothetical protein
VNKATFVQIAVAQERKPKASDDKSHAKTKRYLSRYFGYFFIQPVLTILNTHWIGFLPNLAFPFEILDIHILHSFSQTKYLSNETSAIIETNMYHRF